MHSKYSVIFVDKDCGKQTVSDKDHIGFYNGLLGAIEEDKSSIWPWTVSLGYYDVRRT